jgi:hypothetical protein
MSQANPITFYRGYVIEPADPPPIPGWRNFVWSYAHENYDGAPDANDPRCGRAASLDACKAEIDWIEDANLETGA